MTNTQEQKLSYLLDASVVNFILNALNRNQISGVQQAKDLLTVVELLQKPLNAEELEREQYDALKDKFEKDERKSN